MLWTLAWTSFAEQFIAVLLGVLTVQQEHTKRTALLLHAIAGIGVFQDPTTSAIQVRYVGITDRTPKPSFGAEVGHSGSRSTQLEGEAPDLGTRSRLGALST
jgi:uncharacterized membrane protein